MPGRAPAGRVFGRIDPPLLTGGDEALRTLRVTASRPTNVPALGLKSTVGNLNSRWPRTARSARIERPPRSRSMKSRQAFVVALVMLALETGGPPATPSRAGARRAGAARTAGPGPRPAGPRRTGQHADIPWAAGRHAGAANESVHVKEFLQGPGALAGPALFPLPNTPRQMTDIWTSGRIGDKPPASASWGACNEDYPRKKILSAQPVQDRARALRGTAGTGQGRRRPDGACTPTMPDWDGWYARVPKRMPARSRCGHHQPGSHHSVPADAGVPEAHGADELPREP